LPFRLGVTDLSQDRVLRLQESRHEKVMAVDVTTTPTFQAGTPRILFTLPGRLRGDPQQWKNVSREGQRFVFAIDVPVRTAAR